MTADDARAAFADWLLSDGGKGFASTVAVCAALALLLLVVWATTRSARPRGAPLTPGYLPCFACRLEHVVGMREVRRSGEVRMVCSNPACRTEYAVAAAHALPHVTLERAISAYRRVMSRPVPPRRKPAAHARGAATAASPEPAPSPAPPTDPESPRWPVRLREDTEIAGDGSARQET